MSDFFKEIGEVKATTCYVISGSLMILFLLSWIREQICGTEIMCMPMVLAKVSDSKSLFHESHLTAHIRRFDMLRSKSGPQT